MAYNVPRVCVERIINDKNIIEMQITEEQIRKIAVSHQRQMASVHPHAIIGTIEDAINEALVIAGVIVRSEQLICPCCGSDKTYKTDAIHCNRCAVTTEI